MIKTMEYIKQNYKGFLISGSIILLNALLFFAIGWDTGVYIQTHETSIYGLIIVVPYLGGYLLSAASFLVGLPLLFVGISRRKKFPKLTNHIIDEQ